MLSQSKSRVLVLGWYGHGNLGDESFRSSFQCLWPQYDFDFRDSVPGALHRYDFCMFGGGNFLDQDLPGLERIPASMPVAFVGIGVGGHISEGFRELLLRAKAIVLRDAVSARKLPTGINASRVLVTSDLFYARAPSTIPVWHGEQSNRVCVFISEHLAPRGNEPFWKDSGWQEYLREQAICLDVLVERGLEISFVPFSTTAHHDDRRAAASLCSRMLSAHRTRWDVPEPSEESVLQLIASSRLVISMRLHGMIFSSSVGCPFIAICGHDKSHNMSRSMGWKFPVDMYNVRWRQLLALGDDAMQQRNVREISNLEGKFEQWHVASEFVAAKLSL